MRRLDARLWLTAVAAALVTGCFGGWMLDAAIGNVAVAEIDGCYTYYIHEVEHFRCEGYWDQPAVSGPVVGLSRDPDARLLDTEGSALGYRVGAPRARVFVTLNGDAAVVVPKSHKVLGPLGLAALLGCGIVLARRLRAPKPTAYERAGSDLP